MDTIFALSSGAPPAGIAVLRISGPAARNALITLAGALPEPRRATYRILRGSEGAELDRALVLWLPGPRTATGEDLAELHLHGGRAVIDAVQRELATLPQLRLAQPGEFTRRAFANGRIDLNEAEGLADLLSAETEMQRRAALAAVGGVLSRKVEGWRVRLLQLSALVEAALDFSEEDEVGLPPSFHGELAKLGEELTQALAAPAAETLQEGYRVALAGPPNAGKSTLFNALVGSEAAITTPIPGTTRDVLTRPVAIAGVPLLLVDMAGLRDGADAIEAIGIARAADEIARADLVLWLGPEGQGPAGSWEIEAQWDRADRFRKVNPEARVSAVTGLGMDELRLKLADQAGAAMPRPGEAALNRRQRRLLTEAAVALQDAAGNDDPLLVAEQLRHARLAFDRLTGHASTEDVLDTLFGRFCLGK